MIWKLKDIQRILRLKLNKCEDTSNLEKNDTSHRKKGERETVLLIMAILESTTW